MSKKPSTLERLATYRSVVPNEQAYLQSFIKGLVENPGAVTVREISIVSGLVELAVEDLFLLATYWSEWDLDLELEAMNLQGPDQKK